MRQIANSQGKAATSPSGEVDLKFVIDDRYGKGRQSGKRAQRNRIWEREREPNGKAHCATCGARIERKSKIERDWHRIGQWHHLIKQQHFLFPCDDPTPEQQRSKHHESNGILLCRQCHLSRWEGWTGERPHIATWLFSDVTGQEIPLSLAPGSVKYDKQPVDWNSAQRVAERRGEYQCSACGHHQQRVTKPVYDSDRRAFQYTGPDVRAVHVIPPTHVPELSHHPSNLTLLCWDCIFGKEARNCDDVDHSQSWLREPTDHWVDEFAPQLREY